MSIRREDGRIYCSMTRPAFIPGESAYQRLDMDLNKKYYVMLAVGNAYPGKEHVYL